MTSFGPPTGSGGELATIWNDAEGDAAGYSWCLDGTQLRVVKLDKVFWLLQEYMRKAYEKGKDDALTGAGLQGGER